MEDNNKIKEISEIYETIFDNAPDGILLADIENNNFYIANKMICQMLGYSLEEIKNMGIMDIHAEEDLPYVIEQFEKQSRKEIVIAKDIPVKRKDGSIFYADVNSVSITLSGKPYVAGIFRDITERKEAEALMKLRYDLVEYAGTHALEELLQKTLDEIGALTNSPIGFYHFVEPDQKTLSLQAWSTRTVKEFCTAKGKGMHYGIDQAGVWADCVYERKPVIHNDYLSLPHRKGLPEGHAAVIRELVVPIMREDHVVAILGIGNKPTDYTEKDAYLVSFIADVAWEITKRKRAEEALRESEARLKRSQEIAHLGSWELDLVKNELMWSDEVYRIFGLQPQEFGATYEAFLERVHPEDRASVDAAYSGSVRDGRDSYEIEHRVVRKGTGEVRWIHEKCQHERDANGRIIRSLGMVHDITERKKAEEALLESEKRYRSLFENMLEGSAYCKMLFDHHDRPVDFVYLDVNSAFGRLTGLENVVGKKVTEVIPGIKESQPELFEIYGRVALTGQPEKFEIEFKPLAMWLSVSVYSTEREYFVAVFDNITERKRAEEELREAHDELEMRVQERTTEIKKANRALRMLYECDQVIVHATDEMDFLRDICRTIVEVGGYRMAWVGFAERDGGKKVRPVAQAGYEEGYLESLNITWADSERGRGPTGTAIRTGTTYIARNISTDPSFVPWRAEALKRGYASSIAIPLIAEDQTLGALMMYAVEPDAFDTQEVILLKGMADDIAYCISSIRVRAEHKRTDEELKKYREHLEAMVEERTEELKWMSDELKRSNEDLQQFAHAASHDLQEPLRGVASFAKLLEKRYKGRLDEKADEFIDYIIDDTKRMQMLIKDLLEYSQVSAKGIVFRPTNCSVALEQAIYNLRSAIEESGAEVTYDLLPTVKGDEAQLSRVFQNLISNAIKFRSQEPLKIHISARRKKDEWIFTMRDTGIGIDPKQSERIFVMFQRLHTRAEYPGTGIGLAMCRKIVERHGGRIWVESELGKGSTFYFTIPE